MTDDVNYRGMANLLVIAGILILVLAAILSSGCVTAAKNIGKEVMKTPSPTPTPIPTPTPSPTPTPIPTPSSMPTLAAHYVDPFAHGERWQGQWFKWLRRDIQGINGLGTKDLYIGIIAYRSGFYDRLTWYNAPMGNYYSMTPADGNRYFVVWVHEEMFGDNTTFDPSMWLFDSSAFALQVKGKAVHQDPEYNPVNIIHEFDTKYDFYNAVIAPPFGYRRIYAGHNPETAGWVADRLGWLRMGQGNSATHWTAISL